MARYAVLQEKTDMSHGNGPIPRRIEPREGPAMPTIVTTTDEEYEAATREVQELTGAPQGSHEEHWLIDLVEAIEARHAKHDDATARR